MTWIALHHFTQREARETSQEPRLREMSQVGWLAFLGSLLGFVLSFMTILLARL